jgi:predicted ATPase
MPARRAEKREGITSPFLRSIRMLPDIPAEDRAQYPLDLPILREGLDLVFTRPVTVLVGANGSGKSTLIEAIAANCGLSLIGGTRNVAHRAGEDEGLSRWLRFSWTLKVGQGYFFRAETFGNFARLIDDIADEAGPGDTYAPYGGTSLRARSHGQSVMAILHNRLHSRGIFLLDEPEAALAPLRQIEFLKQMRRLDVSGKAQLVIATHSPLLMAYPGADLWQLDDNGVRPIEFHDTEHFKLLRNFYLNPDGFMAGVMMDAEEEVARD